MTQDEIGVMLNLRATLSEYEHFMTHLSLMIEKGTDIPLFGTLAFPMKDRLYKQVRDLVISPMPSSPDRLNKGDIVTDRVSGQKYRVFATNMVALQDTEADAEAMPIQYLHESLLK